MWELSHIFSVVRIIAKRTLREFWIKHPQAEEPLKTWYDVASGADWSSPNDIKFQYAHASILPENQVVFNIKGNNYRLVTWINYQKQLVFIKFIGTHAEYNKIDATTYK